LKVGWSEGALIELRAIHDYIAQFSPLAAQRIAQRLISAGDSLATLPDRGRMIGPKRRELVVIAPYLLRYLRENDRVTILEVRHGAKAPD
jgi:plasmid stabilization system protein ParE